ncbi:MAG: hypothetical protein AAGG72_08645 [Pseudomonadota bacterium]
MRESALCLSELLKRQRKLIRSKAKLDRKLFKELFAKHKRESTAPDALLDQALHRFSILASTAETRLVQQADAVKAAEQVLRGFQAENRITRPLKTPDGLKTVGLLMPTWLLETVFASTGLVADGYIDVVPALGFAVTFSTANVCLGLALGYTLRFVSYRSRAATKSLGDAWTRWSARIGCGALSAISAVMVYAGGRVRVTGGKHDGLFDFSEVPFSATFNDSFSLVIMVVAGLSIAVAALKGYSGFADPIPDYADHAGAGNELVEDAQWLAEDALEEISEIAEDTEDDILDGQPDADVLAKLATEIAAFNAQVDDAIADLAVIAQDEWQRRCYAAGEELPAPELDMSALDAMRIDPDILNDADVAATPLDRLHSARTEASSRVSTAHTAFLAKVSAFRAPFIPT